MTKKTIIIIIIAAIVAIGLGAGAYYWYASTHKTNIFNNAIEKGATINIQDAAKSNTTK